MSVPPLGIYRFGGLTLDLVRGSLRNGGADLPLRPKSFNLLTHFVTNAGRLLTKDELMQAAWPGVFVTEDSLVKCVKEIRQALADSERVLIKAIPGRGYIFDLPVTVAEPAGTAGSVPPRAYKPSIAILPFQNMSGDPEQEYFADGVVEEVTAALSRVRSFSLIARNSAFTYKGKTVDVKQVARELGVRYILEGSVRKAANRVRIIAQLVDAESGNQLWAERYDRDATDVFTVQDEITSSVAAAIQPALEQTERDRASRKPPDSLDAWESYHRALWHFLKVEAHENERSREFFKRALALDPGFALAYAGLALTYAWEGIIFSPNSRPRVVPLCEEQARKSISLDPMEASGHIALGTAFCLCGRSQEAISEANTALAINPNYAWAHGFLGSVLTWTERPHDAIAPLERAIRLSPFDPMTWKWLHAKYHAYFYSRELEPAIATAREVIRTRPELRFAHTILVSALGHLGRYEEARAAFDVAVANCGEIFTERLRATVPEESAANKEYELEGFRKAGLL